MGFKDFLFGEKKGPDPLAGLAYGNAGMGGDAQRMGIRGLLDSPDGGAVADSEYARQSTALQTNLADIRRRIQQNIARQGISRTSIGLNAIRSAEKDTTGKLQLLSAMQPGERIKAIQAHSQNLINAGNSIIGSNNVPVDFTGGRKGGAFPLLTTIAGGAAGAFLTKSPQGAAAGAQMGQGVGTGVQGLYS